MSKPSTVQLASTNKRMEAAAERLLMYMADCMTNRETPSYFSAEALEVSCALVEFRRVHNIKSSNPKLREE